MIKTRAQACQMLGISFTATPRDIKSAYKSLVKIYHPDSGIYGNCDRYNEVVEAYDFLCKDDLGKKSPEKLYGAGRQGASASRETSYSRFRPTASAADHAAFEKKMAKQRQEKKAQFEQMAAEYSRQIEKQEADYKRAMEAIDALRAARAIEAMVWANGLGKNEP